MIFVILHLGSESREVMATGHKRPASTDFGDRHSKKVRGELINYDHHEGTVKILHVPNDLVHFPKTPSLTYYRVKFNSGPRYYMFQQHSFNFPF